MPTSPAPIFQPFEKFQRIASIIRLLLRCLLNYRRISLVSHVSQMSFAMLSSDMVATTQYRNGLEFDPNDYRALSEVRAVCDVIAVQIERASEPRDKTFYTLQVELF